MVARAVGLACNAVLDHSLDSVVYSCMETKSFHEEVVSSLPDLGDPHVQSILLCHEELQVRLYGCLEG